MEHLLQWLRNKPLSQQLALSAAGCCLMATMTLIAVLSQSTQAIHGDILAEYGRSSARQLATRLSGELAAGDRLGIAAELQFYSGQSTIAGARVVDLEGAELAIAGTVSTETPFIAPILIDGNTAGSIEIYLELSQQHRAMEALIWGLIALSALLSIAVYALTRPMGQRLASNINEVVAQLEMVSEKESDSNNEVHKLRAQINALPLELLRTRNIDKQTDEHYNDTAILCIALRHLPGYLDTLDESRLQAYVATLHRIAYGSASFYGGKLTVIRQFGLAIYFSGTHSIGSPVVRAASCGWLISHCSRLAEQHQRLSFSPGIAIGISELGLGDQEDIYPGLYIQATLDELLELANQEMEAILFSSRAAEDRGLDNRIGVDVIDERWMAMGEISNDHLDLLERQLCILKRVIKAPNEETQQELLPF